jgi:arylsulfatase A-like enzyme
MSSSINRREFLKLAGLAGLLSSKPLRALADSTANSGNPSQSNILIIVFDALSALNMSIYGYARETTPNLTRLAQKATVFNNHYTGGIFTTPGTASLLTGALPWSHRAFHLNGSVSNPFISQNIFSTAPDGTFTNSYSHNNLVATLLYQFRSDLNQLGMPRKLALADLKYSDRIFKNDYHIAFKSEDAILRGDKRVAGSLFFSYFYNWLSNATTLKLNAEYKEHLPQGVPHLNGVYFKFEDSIDWAIEQIKTMPQPYLAYFHFLPPHEPYTVRRDFKDLFNDDYAPPEKPESFVSEGKRQKNLDMNRRRYDRYIAYLDSEFARLFGEMEQSGQLENTTLILTADHGELFERGILGHVAPVMYEPLVHIPLVIFRPGQSSRQDVIERTSSTDVLPTILSVYNQPTPEWSEGQILPTFQAQKTNSDRTLYAMDCKSASKHGELTSGTYMAFQGDYKLVHYMEDPDQNELFNLANDPEELENLIKSEPAIAADLMGQLTDKLNQVNEPYSA